MEIFAKISSETLSYTVLCIHTHINAYIYIYKCLHIYMHTCTLLLFKHCCYWKLIWSFSFYISLYISIVSIRIFLLMRMFLSSFSFRRNFTSNALSSVHIYLNCQWILSSITIKNLTRHFRHNFTDANFLYTSLHIIDNRKWIFSFLIFLSYFYFTFLSFLVLMKN